MRWFEDRDAIAQSYELLAGFADAIARACAAPLACAPILKKRRLTFRARRISGFRFYRIVFVIRGEELRVIAVEHARRRPHYWKWRLRECVTLTSGERSKKPTRKKAERVDISRIFEEGVEVDRAFDRAIREALLMHKRAGNPVPILKDGKVVWIPPHKIRP
jgi:hypothetical protein